MKLLPLASLPAVNASLNAVCTVFLLLGFAFIRNGKIRYHRFCMIVAFLCSTVFLCFYLWFHFHAGVIRFGGQGWIRPVYFTLLITHTILAIAVLPLVITTLSFALAKNFLRHRAVARWTFPIWLYVSFTGVVIYWLLYIAYAPVGGPV